jgi:hypothetical protein
VSIEVRGDGNTTHVSPAAPSGAYCVDVPLAPVNGTTSLDVSAVTESGVASEPTLIDVERFHDAWRPVNPTCADVVTCQATETCGTEEDNDDDCNGLSDSCDPACTGCPEDAFSPNATPARAAVLRPGNYYGLWLCPCETDWFRFELDEDATVQLSASFDGDAIDVDLRLYGGLIATSENSAPVASSISTEPIESIEYTAQVAGTYYLRVYSFKADKSGEYSLTRD